MHGSTMPVEFYGPWLNWNENKSWYISSQNASVYIILDEGNVNIWKCNYGNDNQGPFT